MQHSLQGVAGFNAATAAPQLHRSQFAADVSVFRETPKKCQPCSAPFGVFCGVQCPIWVEKERSLSFRPNEKEIFWSLFFFNEIVGHGHVRTCHYGSKYFYDDFL